MAGMYVDFIKSQLGTAVDRVHLACRLNHEIEHDGYRSLLIIEGRVHA